MPDNKTLIYARDEGAMFAATRSSTAAGDAAFVERAARVALVDTADMLPGETLFEINPMSISCDGRSLIYARSFKPDRWDIRVVEITDASGPTFGTPRKHSDYDRSFSDGHIQRVVESPDCSTLFVRSATRQLLARRKPCR